MYRAPIDLVDGLVISLWEAIDGSASATLLRGWARSLANRGL